ncbi:MAG: hypothetical protein LBN02_06835 [Oscillospiraceae bacterium]|jgi:hypothetical protein|nr:hypothetical protein [Oscillospiraceae bacterium]
MARKPPRPYNQNPERVARGYDASVLLSDGIKPPRFGIGAMFVLTALLLLGCLFQFAFQFDKHGYFAFSAMFIAFVASAYMLHTAFALRRRQKAVIADGGFITKEGANRLDHAAIGPVVGAAVFTLFLIMVVAFVIVSFQFLDFTALGFTASGKVSFSILSTTSLLTVGVTWMSPFPVIFCGDRFIVGRFEIAYDGLTVEPIVKPVGDEDKQLGVIFRKNGRRVGHDNLYREDYEHLRERLAQTEVHDGT